MNTQRDATSRTLLERVRDPGDRAAWERFFALYAPLLEGYAKALGLPQGDVQEVRDDCLALVAGKIAQFQYDPAKGGFKGWLYELARGRVVDRLRRCREQRADSAVLAAVVDPNPSPDELWEQAWRCEHLRFALREASEGVSERSFQVFELLLLQEASVPDVCRRMGMNANQVYKAKARVLARVREILERLGTDPPLPRDSHGSHG